MNKKHTVATLAVIFSVATTSYAPAYALDEPPLSNTNHAQKTHDSESAQEKVTVNSGDSLSSIAKQHDTTWVRIFNANKSIKHPDMINPGDVIVVPVTPKTEKKQDRYEFFSRAAKAATEARLKEEAAKQEAERQRQAAQLAAQQAVQQQVRITQQQRQPQVAAQQPTPVAPAAPAPSHYTTNAGNRYAWGYCTWYVYNKKPNIGSFWGNAANWPNAARAAGFAVNNHARVGAIAVQGNHVAYVEAVNGSMITISEMNFNGGIGVVNTRTVPAGSFVYIQA